MKFKTTRRIVFLFLLLATAFPAMSFGQLPRDVRDRFSGMLGDLDDDLRQLFQTAIDDNTATVFFSPEQFRRFRRHPANPFEGLEHIPADDNGGNIALKFELPSIRNRRIGQWERQSESNLTATRQVAQSVSPSVVAIFHEGRQIALGTVVDTDGHLISKLDEVAGKSELEIVTAEGESFPVVIVHENKNNDLAILKTNAPRLTPIAWTSTSPLTGSFVISPGTDGSVMSIGTYSVTPRSTRSGRQALLGVNPETVAGGVRVTDIEPGNASFEAGLVDGDVITSLAGQPIVDVTSLVNSIRERAPGDEVTVEFLRRGQPQQTTAILSGRDVSGERAQRFKMMSRLGAIPSRRSDNFPRVFQHDGPLFPEECGGPVLDLQGRVIGINIARNGRAATFAIPTSHVKRLVGNFLRQSVARRNVRGVDGS